MKESERTRVIEFLKKHVIGRTVVAAPVTTHTDQGRVEGTYEDQTFFSNLMETVDGFHFDMTVIARGTVYDMDDGAKVQPGGSLDAARVYRYEITERRSSGRLVGFARFVSSTNNQPDPLSGTIFLVQVRLEHGTLIVEETQAGYADLVATQGAYQCVAIDGTYRYVVEGGKLVMHYQQKTFDVDPKTLHKTPTTDHFPPQVSKEIGPPPGVAGSKKFD